MKETYGVPRLPETGRYGNLVDSGNSEELMSVLGFCTSETPAAQTGRQGETRGIHAIKTSYSKSDDDVQVYQKDNSFHARLEVVELAVAAK
ncbi:MAG: hypothetical protein ACLP5H_16245 [Desulfomonilaceae bacterium]